MVLGLPGSAPRTALSDPESPPADPGKLIRRAYSIASTPLVKDELEFYVTLVRSGALTPRLWELHPGDRVWLSNKPVGMFTLVDLLRRAPVGVVHLLCGRLARHGDGDTPARLKAIAAKLLSEPVRYGKPGLQAHINYLASMTANVDQKIGRDAIERYGVLKKEFDAASAEVDRLLGPARQ